MSLRLQQIQVSYGSGPRARHVLAGLDVEFPAGMVTAIIGLNGAGKSTLLRAAMGLLPVGAGEILLDGVPLHDIPRRERPRRIVYVPQRSDVAFAFTAREVVAMGRRAAGEGESSQSNEAIARALTLVELAERSWDRVGELSAGQQQRVTFARALVQLEVAMAPRTLPCANGIQTAPTTVAFLADEPVSAMDLRHAVQTLNLMRDAATAGAAVAVVLHDLTLAARVADRAVVLAADGTLAAQGPASEVLTATVLGPVLGVALGSAVLPGGVRMLAPAAPITGHAVHP